MKLGTGSNGPFYIILNINKVVVATFIKINMCKQEMYTVTSTPWTLIPNLIIIKYYLNNNIFTICFFTTVPTITEAVGVHGQEYDVHQQPYQRSQQNYPTCVYPYFAPEHFNWSSSDALSSLPHDNTATRMSR